MLNKWWFQKCCERWEKKIIPRQEHETDTRAKTIQPTDAGREKLQKAIIQVENTDKEFFATIEANLSSFNADMLKLIDENKGE